VFLELVPAAEQNMICDLSLCLSFLAIVKCLVCLAPSGDMTGRVGIEKSAHQLLCAFSQHSTLTPSYHF
jgi:hypothetical protein